MFTNNKNKKKITSKMPGPTMIYLGLVVNKTDLIHFPARRKEQLIKTNEKRLVSGGCFFAILVAKIGRTNKQQ